MKYEKVEFKLAELFCGPGGLGLGAKTAVVRHLGKQYSVKPVWAIDIDPDACRTYARNIHNGKSAGIVCADIRKLDLATIPEFDALAFGFPCNDFSIVGEQKGFSGTFGPLYTFGVKAINLQNPKWFIAENVGGLQTANEGLAFKKIIEDLSEAGIGYHLTVNLYKFENYGVPQYRHRLVIVGTRKDLGLIFKVPAPTTKGRHVSAGEAINKPPIAVDADNNELTAQSEKVVERLKYIPPGENAWFEGIPDELKLNVRGARLSQIYKRLDSGKPAYTITGSGGGGTHVYHWSENRALTNRERARLQSFPDDFVFEGSKESVRKQIGMAVPPLAAKTVIVSILKTFAGVPYDFIEPTLSNGNKAP